MKSLGKAAERGVVLPLRDASLAWSLAFPWRETELVPSSCSGCRGTSRWELLRQKSSSKRRGWKVIRGRGVGCGAH